MCFKIEKQEWEQEKQSEGKTYSISFKNYFAFKL